MVYLLNEQVSYDIWLTVLSLRSHPWGLMGPGAKPEIIQ